MWRPTTQSLTTDGFGRPWQHPVEKWVRLSGSLLADCYGLDWRSLALVHAAWRERACHDLVSESPRRPGRVRVLIRLRRRRGQRAVVPWRGIGSCHGAEKGRFGPDLGSFQGRPGVNLGSTGGRLRIGPEGAQIRLHSAGDCLKGAHFRAGVGPQVGRTSDHVIPVPTEAPPQVPVPIHVRPDPGRFRSELVRLRSSCFKIVDGNFTPPIAPPPAPILVVHDDSGGRYHRIEEFGQRVVAATTLWPNPSIL